MDFIFDPSLVLYLPLYEQDGSSFMSKDAYGHPSTVTGAVWRPNGHYFDGTDDRITTGSIGNLTDMTAIVWFKPDSPANYEGIFALSGLGSQSAWSVRIRANHQLTGYGAAGVSFGIDSAIYKDIWYMVALMSDASDTYLDVDGGRLSACLGSGNASSKATDIYIGTYYDGSATRSFNGTIGEFVVYNRKLTSQEIQHNYLATKWRYQ